MVYVPVMIAVWLVIPSFGTLMMNISTSIVNGVCIPMGVYSSVAVEKTVAFFILFVAYLLPLTMMIFLYSRIIHVLRTKVNKTSSLLFRILVKTVI